MNYYRRYIGDFHADTMSLSMLEQGAYDRLLDFYYATEKPIPLNSDRAAIICRALTLEDRAAVQAVLESYFERHADGWHNVRADKEIELARTRSDGAKAAGKLGAEARWNGNEHSGANGKVDSKTDSKSHGAAQSNGDDSPTTNHQPPRRSKPLSADADYPPAFLRFWEAWPSHKRKQGKFKSGSLWRGMKLEPFGDEIIAHVEAMKTCEQWREGFIPMPETYLRNRRWEDGKAPERKSPRLAI